MKIVALSDTHGLHRQLEIPDGDIIVFAGDITSRGELVQLADFSAWLERLPHKHKIIIAGNHDFCFEKNREVSLSLLPKNIIYLEDQAIKIDGTWFYGSPYTPDFYNWAFMLPRGEALARKWTKIPDYIDVLITHGPPYGIRDYITWHDLSKGKTIEDNVGCESLRNRIKLLSLKAHIFGHIHNQHGGSGIFHNVAICNQKYQPVNPPTIIDL